MRKEEALAFFFNATPHPVAVADKSGIITEINPAFAGIKRGIKKRFAGQHLRSIIHPAEQKNFDRLLRRLRAGGLSETATIRPDTGFSKADLLGIEIQALGKGRAHAGYLLMIRNSSSARQKKTETKEHEYPFPLIRVDKNGRIVSGNTAYGKLLAGKKQKNFLDFFPVSERKRQEKALNELFAGKKQVEFIHRVPSDAHSHIRWTRAGKIETDQQLVLLCGIACTRENKDAEALRKSEKRLNEAQQIAHIGNWEWDILSGELYWSEEIFRIFGQSQKKFKASYEAFLQTIHPEDRPLVEDKVARALNRQEKYNIVHRIVLPDGKTRYVREIGHAIFREKNTPVRMIGTVQDITEQVLLEQKYKEAHQVLENSVNAIVHTDLQGKIIYANPASAVLWGYDSTSVMLAEKPVISDYWHKDSFELALKIHEVLKANDRYTGQEKLKAVKKNKTLFYPTINAAVTRDLSGRKTGYIGIFNDATAQILAEEQIRKYDSHLRFILSSIDVIIYSVSFEDAIPVFPVINYVSDAFEKQLGIEAEEFREKWMELVHPDDLGKLIESTTNAFHSGQRTTRSFRVYSRVEQAYLWFEDRFYPVLDNKGKVKGFYGSTRDISERTRYEEELLKSKKTYKSLYENALVGIFRTDVKTKRPVTANDTCCRLFGYDSQEEFLSKFIATEHYVDIKERDDNFHQLFRDGQINDSIIHFRKANGDHFWGQFSVKLIPETTEIEGVVIDVTEQVNYERQLRASLQEKELLLKEVHHRVKNNLQVISGLLQIQADKYNNSEVSSPLLESMARIRSIASAHEHLYQSENLAEIDFTGYLNKLAVSVMELATEKKIDIRFSGNKLTLDIEKAIPLGMIFNELVSNSIKHGFKGQESGTIDVKIEKDKDVIVMSIDDDGQGFENNFSAEEETLGWKLVKALARQVKGNIQMFSSPGFGATAIISIPHQA